MLRTHQEWVQPLFFKIFFSFYIMIYYSEKAFGSFQDSLGFIA